MPKVRNKMEYKNINVTGALITASRKGQLEIVEYMHANGADIRASNDLALRFAIGHGHLGVADYLMTNGADIHSIQDVTLLSSVKCGNLDTVKYLISNGANINAREGDVFSVAVDNALSTGDNKESIEIVKYLVDNGVDIHVQSDEVLMRIIDSECVEVMMCVSMQLMRERVKNLPKIDEYHRLLRSELSLSIQRELKQKVKLPRVGSKKLKQKVKLPCAGSKNLKQKVKLPSLRIKKSLNFPCVMPVF